MVKKSSQHLKKEFCNLKKLGKVCDIIYGWFLKRSKKERNNLLQLLGIMYFSIQNSVSHDIAPIHGKWEFL